MNDGGVVERAKYLQRALLRDWSRLLENDAAGEISGLGQDSRSPSAKSRRILPGYAQDKTREVFFVFY